MARKRRESDDEVTATWVWPPLEPGETQEMRDRRITESLLPLAAALARQQAWKDHIKETRMAVGIGPSPSAENSPSRAPVGVHDHSTNPRPFTAETLAERWGCSTNHVRNLVHRGQLRAFRIGARLLRIPADAVDEYEQSQLAKTADEIVHKPRPQPQRASMGTNDPIVIIHSPERKRRPTA